jgi:hypothetical protein
LVSGRPFPLRLEIGNAKCLHFREMSAAWQYQDPRVPGDRSRAFRRRNADARPVQTAAGPVLPRSRGTPSVVGIGEPILRLGISPVATSLYGSVRHMTQGREIDLHQGLAEKRLGTVAHHNRENRRLYLGIIDIDHRGREGLTAQATYVRRRYRVCRQRHEGHGRSRSAIGWPRIVQMPVSAQGSFSALCTKQRLILRERVDPGVKEPAPKHRLLFPPCYKE